MVAVKRNSGFTLMDLLMTVALVGILTSIAYPSYQEQLRKTRRADAQGALMGLSGYMERHFTATNSYLGAAGTKNAPADTGTPDRYSANGAVPLSGASPTYRLEITDATASTYVIHAIPVNVQEHDNCGTLTLNQAGERNVEDAATGFDRDTCWK
jgi:type IV pilus assembly protein PilE